MPKYQNPRGQGTVGLSKNIVQDVKYVLRFFSF